MILSILEYNRIDLIEAVVVAHIRRRKANGL